MTGRLRGMWSLYLALALLGSLACRRGRVVADMNDPCTLLTDDDIAEVLHLTVEQRQVNPKSFSIELGGGAGRGGRVSRSSGKACSISATNRSLANFSAIIFGISFGTRDEFQQEMARTAFQNGTAIGPGERLRGIGDKAFWNAATETVGVQRGTCIILIDGMPDRATAVALITRAADHLP